MVDRPAATVARRVLSRLERLLPRLAAAYRTVPEYGRLPAGVLENEVLPVSREIIATFLRAVVEGREPSVENLDVLRAMGRRRLEMGVPLEPMLHVYRIAGREVFDEIVAASGGVDKEVLASLGRAWMDYIDRASSVAASSYLEASHERLRRIDAERDALLGSLLAAEDASDVAAVAAQFAVVLADAYAPLLVAGPGIAAHVDQILRTVPPGSIAGFRGGHVVVLVPDRLPSAGALTAGLEPVTVAYGAVVAPGAELVREVRRAESVLVAALATHRTGVFGPDDLLLERLVTGNAAVAETLRRTVLEPIRSADRGGLVESTLRAFLDTGSVPETAAKAVVHPNTVAYRLRSVARRTGLDPRTPRDAAVLVLALLADDVRRAVVRSTTQFTPD